MVYKSFDPENVKYPEIEYSILLAREFFPEDFLDSLREYRNSVIVDCFYQTRHYCAEVEPFTRGFELEYQRQARRIIRLVNIGKRL